MSASQLKMMMFSGWTDGSVSKCTPKMMVSLLVALETYPKMSPSCEPRTIHICQAQVPGDLLTDLQVGLGCIGTRFGYRKHGKTEEPR